MSALRLLWWRTRRQVIAWARDRYSDGSTIINVWVREFRQVVPRRWPWWLRWLAGE